MSSATVFITDRPFWRPDAEISARERELLGFLAANGVVDLVYLGTAVAEFGKLSARLAKSAGGTRIHCESLPFSLDVKRTALRLANLIDDRWPARVIVAAKGPEWITDCIPAEIPAILDLGGEDLGAQGDDPAAMARLFARFDRIAFAHARAYKRACTAFGTDLCLLSGQPASFRAEPAPVAVRRLGAFFGTRPVDGASLNWLMRVWQHPAMAGVRRAGIEVVAGGTVAEELADLYPEFRFVGPVERVEPFVAAVEIVIAPQQEGTAAPLSLAAALGSGRPLLATPSALSDLPEAARDCCAVVTEPEAAAELLAGWAANPETRHVAAARARRGARFGLSPEACFAPLLAPTAVRRPVTRTVESRGTDSVRELLQRGTAHQAAGRHRQAEHLFRRVLLRAPEHPEALTALGEILVRRGDGVQAAGILRRALAEGAAGVRTLAALAEALNLANRPAEAAEAAARGLRREADSPRLLLAQARAYRGLGQTGSALAVCRRAAHLDPDSAEIRHELGLCLWGRGALAEAEAALRLAVEGDDPPPAWNGELARLAAERRALPSPRRARVALCAAAGGRPRAWEPIWRLPHLEFESVEFFPDSGDLPSADRFSGFDLTVTDRAEAVAAVLAAGGEVWLHLAADAPPPPANPGLSVFRDAPGRAGWGIADIAAHLAAWSQRRLARPESAKAVDEPAAVGYIPPKPRS